MTRRQLLTSVGVFVAGCTLHAAQDKKDAKLATVTLTIDGMT